MADKQNMTSENKVIAKDNTQKCIVYVDDNESNIMLMEQVMLHYPDIKFVTSQVSTETIDLVKEHHPQLVLLDLNMPELTGYDIIKILKKEEFSKGIPVIAVTASAMDSEVQQGMEAGFYDYVTKPIDIQAFYKLIDNFFAAK